MFSSVQSQVLVGYLIVPTPQKKLTSTKLSRFTTDFQNINNSDIILIAPTNIMAHFCISLSVQLGHSIPMAASQSVSIKADTLGKHENGNIIPAAAHCSLH